MTVRACGEAAAGLVSGADAIAAGATPAAGTPELLAGAHKKNTKAKLISRAPKPITPTNTERMDFPFRQAPTQLLEPAMSSKKVNRFLPTRAKILGKLSTNLLMHCGTKRNARI